MIITIASGELLMRYVYVRDKKGAEDTSYLAKYKKNHGQEISCSEIHLSTIYHVARLQHLNLLCLTKYLLVDIQNEKGLITSTKS